MKLIKLSDDHYVVVDDSEIKEGDFVYSSDGGIFKRHIDNPCQTIFPISKVTHSTNIDWHEVYYIPLSEVKDLIGEVYVEKKMISPYPMNTQNDVDWCNGHQRGYKQALEDNKNKVSLKDLKRFLAEGRYTISKDLGGNITADFTELISLLTSPKTEWDVEFVDGKLKLKQ